LKEFFPLNRPIVALAFLCLFNAAAAAQPQTLTGVVTNGTTHQPAAGDDVILLKLGQGMEEQARTKTNARGEFKFSVADAGTPHLIRVRHDNVNYHEPAMDARKSLSITVYNAAAQVPGLKLMEQSEVYQAKANELQVIELFRVSNTAEPPLTQPTFEFYLPEGANVRMGQAMPASGMAVQSAPVPQKEKSKYAFLYPVRPGTTQYELVYTLPYNGKASMEPKFAMAADHFYVVTAQGINFTAGSGTPLRSIDQWPTDPSVTGINTHGADNVAPGKNLSFQISGTGLLPEQEAPAAAEGRGGPQPRPENRPGGGLGVPNQQPDPLHSSQWLFLGVLTLFLAAGATYVYSSNQPAPADAVKKPQDRPAVLLEALKEEIFELESDRLQGKLSPKDYETAKAALDKTLQRAMLRTAK
jgi:hypothetical protein